MKSFFANLLRSTLLRSTALIYSGTLINAGLTFISSIILARVIDPAGYGLFSTALAILYVVNELTDLGVNPSVIRYAASYLQHGEVEKAKMTFRFALRSRIIITTTIVTLGLIATPYLAHYGLKTDALKPLLYLTFTGIIPLIIQSLFSTIFQSQQNFAAHVALSIGSGMMKFVFMVALLLWGHVSPIVALTIFILSPIPALLYCLFKIDLSLFRPTISDPEIIREIKQFSIWMAVWAVFAIIQGQLDQFMVVRQLGAAAAGQYASANQLASLSTFLIGAVGTVLNPRLSGYHIEQLKKAHRLMLAFAGGILLIFALITLVGSYFLPLLFGHRYQEAVIFFQVLMLGNFFFGCSVLPNAILNSLKKPYVFTLTAIVGLLITFVGNLYALPHYGTVGAAYTYDFVNASSFLISFVAVSFLLYTKKREAI